MTDDLVKRLREDQPVTQDMESTIQCALQDEAADRIEALQAERDLAHAAAVEAAAGQLRDAVEDWRSEGQPETDRVAQRIEDEIPGIRTLHTDASLAAIERIKREAREEVLRGVAEALSHVGNEGAASLVTALIEEEGKD